MYKFKRHTARLFLPQFLFTGSILLISYFVVRSQIHWLNYSGAQENMISTYVLLTLLCIMLMKTLQLIQRKKYDIIFHQDHLQFKKYKIPYANIAKVSTKRNILDKLFQTYTLTVNNVKVKGLIRAHLDQYLHTLIETGKTHGLTDD